MTDLSSIITSVNSGVSKGTNAAQTLSADMDTFRRQNTSANLSRLRMARTNNLSKDLTRTLGHVLYLPANNAL